MSMEIYEEQLCRREFYQELAISEKLFDEGRIREARAALFELGGKSMSYYYDYYIGYKSGDKIYPFGPYNSLGKLKAVISRSRSFASDLHYEFYPIEDNEVSDELRKEFEYEDWNGNRAVAVKVLPIDDLPKGSYIKKGYYLIEDIKRYEDPDGKYFEGFFDCISPAVYASMVQNEVRFGKPECRQNDYGELYYPRTASEYMYYAYPDYESKEYEAAMIRNVADMLEGYEDLPEDAILLALETEG